MNKSLKSKFLMISLNVTKEVANKSATSENNVDIFGRNNKKLILKKYYY